ncbi:MAG: hypothetical protein GH149_00770 [Methanosarcinales archaeon]|nr:hypothetical protein [Methanosarcinales archaeon]
MEKTVNIPLCGSVWKYITVGQQLPKYGESYIRFEVPIEKEYTRLERWDLNGYAKYTNGEKTLTILPEKAMKVKSNYEISCEKTFGN